MSNHTIRSVLYLFLIVNFAITTAPAQKELDTSSKFPEPLRDVFVNLMIGENRAGGYVLVEKSCGGEKVFAQKRPSEGQIEDRLDFLIKTNPGYRIIQDDGTINLLPTDYEPEILKARINDYFIDSDKSISVTLDELLALKELRGSADAANLNKGMQIMIGGSGPALAGSRKVKSLSFVTLRQALNEIANFYGKGIWANTEYRCAGKVKSSLSFTKGS